MRYINMILVCGLLLVANGANAGPLAENMDRLIQDGIKIQKMRDRQRRTEILRQYEQERLRIERERLELQRQQLRSQQQQNYAPRKSFTVDDLIERRAKIQRANQEKERLRLEQQRLRLELERLKAQQHESKEMREVLNKSLKQETEPQTGGKPSAWFLISMGANKKWKINDTFEHLAECKKHRAVDPKNTVCVPSDALSKLGPPNSSTPR